MTAVLNLFDIADGNAEAVCAAFEAAVAPLPEDEAVRVFEFRTWVETKALISVNVKLFVIAELLSGGRLRNIYEWAEETAELSGRALDEILKERLRDHYEKRMSFDRAFERGERFRYGALNAGNLGLPVYGPYAVILTREFQDGLKEAACLPGDSLELCLEPGGVFLESAARSLPVPFSHRHWMVARRSIGEVDRKAWPELVADSRDRYYEVIFIGEVSLDRVERVRMSKAEYERNWDLAFANFGRKLGDAERSLIHDFIQLLAGVKNGQVALEVIP